MKVPVLELRNIVQRFNNNPKPVLRGLGFCIEPGEILALAGTSGCGKTTTLRIIAGFQIPDRGEVFLEGELICGHKRWIPPEERRIGVVFQDHALFPHITVRENIAFGLHKLNRTDRKRRIEELIGIVGLAGLEDRYPHQLSGGQMQRVAIAWALAPSPRLLLLDEPFNNLDAGLKRRLLRDVKRTLRITGTSALLVTHEGEEAFSIADRIAVMTDGEIKQLGKPEELFEKPISREVAEFFGPVNHFPNLDNGHSRSDSQPISDHYLVRPGDMILLTGSGDAIVGNGSGTLNTNDDDFYLLEGKIEECIYRGDHQEVRVASAVAPEPIIVRCPLQAHYSQGQRVMVKVLKEKIHRISHS